MSSLLFMELLNVFLCWRGHGKAHKVLKDASESAGQGMKSWCLFLASHTAIKVRISRNTLRKCRFAAPWWDLVWSTEHCLMYPAFRKEWITWDKQPEELVCWGQGSFACLYTFPSMLSLPEQPKILLASVRPGEYEDTHRAIHPTKLEKPTLCIRFEAVKFTKREPRSSTFQYMTYVTSVKNIRNKEMKLRGKHKNR